MKTNFTKDTTLLLVNQWDEQIAFILCPAGEQDTTDKINRALNSGFSDTSYHVVFKESYPILVDDPSAWEQEVEVQAYDDEEENYTYFLKSFPTY